MNVILNMIQLFICMHDFIIGMIMFMCEMELLELSWIPVM